MATLVAGGLFASRALYKYNRKSFMFDKKLKQEREFQEQDMKVAQFSLYREDVRDLVELTVGKMDLYLVTSALLIDRTTVMITKANEALPESSPEWAVALNAMSLASGVFYLLLCLWLAMMASVSAQSFGTRLLTQYVRLPIASQSHVGRATAAAVQYEERGLNELLRVPILQAGESAAAAARSQAAPPHNSRSHLGVMGRLPTENGFIGNPADNVLPAAMLDHIRLYRRVQLNWQAYDAYARVSLFCGANSLLYSCLYWSLGSFLGGQHASVAAIAVALVFATIQVLLTKLDLRLRAWQLRRIALLLGFTPILTTTGMILYADLQNSERGPFAWQRLLMNFCSIAVHFLHAVTANLVLLASWPDAGRDEEALLPGKFRSTLYLDVFGWLLNPTGPGAGARAREDDEDDDRGEGSEPQDGSSSTPPGRRRSSRGSSFPSGPRQSRTAVSFEGGSEQAPSTLQRFRQSLNESFLGSDQASRSRLRENAAQVTFSPEFAREVRRNFPTANTDRSSGRNDREPAGTQEERYGGREAARWEDMARLNEPAADTASTFMGQQAAPRHVSSRAELPGQVPWSAFKRGTQIIVGLWVLSFFWAISKSVVNIYGAWLEQNSQTQTQMAPVLHEHGTLTEALCTGLQQVETLQSMKAKLRFQGQRVADHGCGWRQALDLSLACDASHCLAAILRPGGRSVTMCSAKRDFRALTLTPLQKLWLPSGASSLKSVALHLQGGSWELLARTREASLLALRPRGPKLLLPIFEVEGPRSRSQAERLEVHGDVLFSLQQESYRGTLTAWHLASGARFQTFHDKAPENITHAVCGEPVVVM